MKKYLRAAVKFVIVFTYICLLWTGSEYLFEGAVHESSTDAAVAIIIAWNVTSESMKEWENKKSE